MVEAEDRARVLDPIERVSEVIFGLLMAMTGVGAVFSALALAGRQRSGVGGGVVVWAGVAFGVALVLFSASRSFATAVPLLAIAGAGMVGRPRPPTRSCRQWRPMRSAGG